MVFKGFEAPFSLDWPEGMDPMEILAGHVVPPLPPVDPNSPQLALAAMKRL